VVVHPESFLGKRKLSQFASGAAFSFLLAGLAPNLHSSWKALSGGEAAREWTFGLISPIASIRQNGIGPLTDIHWQAASVAIYPISWAALLVVLGLSINLVRRLMLIGESGPKGR
jgi:ABC-type anion transport system duplicated permease subunit